MKQNVNILTNGKRQTYDMENQGMYALQDAYVICLLRLSSLPLMKDDNLNNNYLLLTALYLLFTATAV